MSRFSLFRRKKSEAVSPDLPYADDSSFMPGNSGRKNPRKPSDVDDPVLPEKKRARRRLVGAVTITLAAIIVLPMIFDSEPQTVSQDLLIDIPSRDKPSQTVSREPVKKKAEEPAMAVLEKPSVEPSPAAQEKKDTARPADSTKEKSATDSKTDTRPAEKSDAKQEVKPDTKTAAQKTDDPIGQLIAQQKAGAKEAQAKPGEQGNFVIQVAAVSTQDKARELQGRLQKAGLDSYTQKVALKEGGERIRIRIGPLSSKKEVNSTCARLSQLKLSCTLVN